MMIQRVRGSVAQGALFREVALGDTSTEESARASSLSHVIMHYNTFLLGNFSVFIPRNLYIL